MSLLNRPLGLTNRDIAFIESKTCYFTDRVNIAWEDAWLHVEVLTGDKYGKQTVELWSRNEQTGAVRRWDHDAEKWDDIYTPDEVAA